MRNNSELLGFVADLATFLIDHLDVSYFGEVLMVSRKIMEVVHPADRIRVYQETFRRCGARNHTWVRTALELGVPSEAIADVMLDKLRAARVDLTSSVCNFLQHDFLRYGSGRVVRRNPLADFLIHDAAAGEAERIGRDMQRFPVLAVLGDDIRMRMSLEYEDPWNYCFEEEHTYWSVLTDDQLVEVVRIIIEKAPNLLFEGPDINREMGARAKLRVRLGDTVLEPLLEEAAGKLTSLVRVSLDELSRLSPLIQLEVARRTGGWVDHVVRLALYMGSESGGKSLLAEFDHLFTGEGSVTAFRYLWKTLQDADDQAMAKFIEQRLLNWTEARGFIYGQVQEGKYFNRKTRREMAQMQVRRRARNTLTIYVQDRYQHRYLPKPGDWVFIKPERGTRLTHKVVSVIFIPAHDTREYHD
jgi:hypothetical protein